MNGPSGSRKCHVVKTETEEFEFFLVVDEERKGQVITSVTKGGPADRAGLKDGDRLVEIDGKNVEENDHNHVVSIIRECVSKNEITFLVIDAKRDPNVKKPAAIEPLPEKKKSTNADTRPRLCKIKKKNNSFGFFLEAGSESGHVVNQVTKGGAAEGTGLKNGDRVIAVNKTNVEKLRYDKVVDLIKKSGSKVALLVIDEKGHQELKKRNVSSVPKEKSVKAAPAKASKSSKKQPVKSSAHKGKTRVVHVLKNRAKGYGFHLQSNKASVVEFIGKVDKDSAADHSGLQKDDRVMAVNGKSIVGMAHGDVIALIKAKKAQVVLVVMDHMAIKHFEEKDNYPSTDDITRSHNHVIRSVKLTKGDGGYGMFLKMEKGSPFHIFADVEKGGVADKAGVKNGEIVIAVGGSSVLTDSHEDCVKKIKEAGSSVEMIVGSRATSDFLHTIGAAIDGDLLQEWPTEEELAVPSFGKTVKSKAESKVEAAKAAVAAVEGTTDKNDEARLKPRLCRVVRHEKGFGFFLKDDKGHYLANIEKDGPAFKAGVLDCDRIVELNGENVEKCIHAEIVRKIRESGTVVTFLVVNKEEDKFFKQKGITITSTLLLDTDDQLADEHKPRVCRLLRTDTGYGFHLMAQPGREGQFIKDFVKGGPADVGGLREGDRIIEVNGSDVAGELHDAVVKKITEKKEEVTFLVIDKEGDAFYKVRNIKIVASLAAAKAVAEKTDAEEESISRASVSSSVIETEATVHQEAEADEEDVELGKAEVAAAVLEAAAEVVEDERQPETEKESDHDAAEQEDKIEEIVVEIKDRAEEKLDEEEKKRLEEAAEKLVIAAVAEEIVEEVQEIRDEAEDAPEIPEKTPESQEIIENLVSEDEVDAVEELVQDIKDEGRGPELVEKVVVAAAVHEIVEEIRENEADKSESNHSRSSTPEPAKEEESPAIVPNDTQEEIVEVIQNNIEERKEEEEDEMKRAQKIAAALVMKEIADKAGDKGDGNDNEDGASVDDERETEITQPQEVMEPVPEPPTPPPTESPKPAIVTATKPADHDAHKEATPVAAVSLAAVLNGSTEKPKLKPVPQPDDEPKAPWMKFQLKSASKRMTVGPTTPPAEVEEEEQADKAPMSTVAALRAAIEKRNREARQQSSAQNDVKNELAELSKQRAAETNQSFQKFGGSVNKPLENGSAKKKNPWVGEGMTIKIIET